MAITRSALACGLVGTLAACSGASPPASPDAATAHPTDVAAEIELGDLDPGRHTYSPFTPRIEVEIPPDGDWITYHLSANFFDVVIEIDDGPIGVMFLNPSAYATEDGAEIAASTPEEAIDILRDRSDVTLSEAREVEIGGLTGLEVDAEFAAENTHIMRVEDGLIGLGPTNDFRAAFFETDAGVLVIGLIAPAGTMDQAVRLTQPVRDSIRIGA